MMFLHRALALLPGARLVGDPQTFFTRVHTDTRSLQPGDLFVALEGEQFDAHDFLPQAKNQGAVCAIATHGLEAAGLSGLEVEDTRLALMQLARGWRNTFDLPLIAVAGSNGKTTVTQMIASILQNWKGQAAFATQGNFNNDIGVSLTLLRLRPDHAVGVVELGMNHPGEIAGLAAMVSPRVALVNNAQREHLEFMQSVEAVATENGGVVASLAISGTAVFPAGDPFTPVWREIAGKRQQVTFALADSLQAKKPCEDADFCGVAKWDTGSGCWFVKAQTPDGALEFSLAAPGLHNVKNALAASACAWAAGVPLASMAKGLAAFVPVKGRTHSQRLWLSQKHCITLVDDTYNANPDSMQAAIELLASLPGPRLLVMGDMGEVGAQGPAFHAEAGELAKTLGVEYLYTLGPLAAVASAAFNKAVDRRSNANSSAAVAVGSGCHFESKNTLNAAVLFLLEKTKNSAFSNSPDKPSSPAIQTVLVKGSRFMQCEHVVQAIVSSAQS